MITLTPFDPADASLVSSWAQDPREVMNWCSRTEAPVPPEVIVGWSDDPDVSAFALSDDDTVIGYGELWNDDEEEEVELARLIVDPSRRGQGHGRRLTTELAAVALLRYPLVVLRLNPGNDIARRSYESAGFSRVDAATEATWNDAQPTAYEWMTYRPEPG